MAARIGHLCVRWMSHGLYESGVGGRSPTNDRGSSNLLYLYPAVVYKSRPGLPVKRGRNVALSDQEFF